eukprot:4940260-Amphidinium_carterae.6
MFTCKALLCLSLNVYVTLAFLASKLCDCQSRASRKPLPKYPKHCTAQEGGAHGNVKESQLQQVVDNLGSTARIGYLPSVLVVCSTLQVRCKNGKHNINEATNMAAQTPQYDTSVCVSSQSFSCCNLAAKCAASAKP